MRRATTRVERGATIPPWDHQANGDVGKAASDRGEPQNSPEPVSPGTGSNQGTARLSTQCPCRHDNTRRGRFKTGRTICCKSKPGSEKGFQGSIVGAWRQDIVAMLTASSNLARAELASRASRISRANESAGSSLAANKGCSLTSPINSGIEISSRLRRSSSAGEYIPTG